MSHAPTLRSIRACLEGAIPAVMATSAPDGTPNVAYISQVLYVDEGHVALSFQFFNKTRENILANPSATVLVLDPVTARYFRLHLRYLRTESHGPLFERMKAQLAGIASLSGLDDVFRLKGADLYAVQRIEPVPGEGLEPPPHHLPHADLLGAVRLCSQRLARCATLEELLQSLLAALQEHLGVQHAMVLMLDASGGHLYTVASHGYPQSGVGSEIPLGQGVIGIAAREGTPVRISHMTHAALYSHVMRNSLGEVPAQEIPYPGLAAPHSQLAVPLVSRGRALGVLFVESALDLQFRYPEEDALMALASHLAAAVDLLQEAADAGDAPETTTTPTAEAEPGAPVRVRHFAVNDSVFVNDTYLIKGVAGAILWKLLRDHERTGRLEFSNRELRLDPALRLPDVCDNLEARLLLLQRRLQESATGILIEKTGRGRFRLALTASVALQET